MTFHLTTTIKSNRRYMFTFTDKQASLYQANPLTNHTSISYPLTYNVRVKESIVVTEATMCQLNK